MNPEMNPEVLPPKQTRRAMLIHASEVLPIHRILSAFLLVVPIFSILGKTRETERLQSTIPQYFLSLY